VLLVQQDLGLVRNVAQEFLFRPAARQHPQAQEQSKERSRCRAGICPNDIYPRTQAFRRPLHYRFFDRTGLVCLPFDAQDPEGSVQTSVRTLCECVPRQPITRLGIPTTVP